LKLAQFGFDKSRPRGSRQVGSRDRRHRRAV